ncbi:MAG TPA: GerMN domain-containing protein [Vicinamibacterales bacterium]
MTRRSGIQIVVGVLLLGLLSWGVTRALENLVTPRIAVVGGGEETSATADVPHITATLYYADADGQSLVPVRREVPLEEGTIAQGRQILAAQLEPAPEPHVSVIPQGTTLRAFYVTERGDAFVDLSREVSANHPGGSFTELLSVYAIVNAVTANLPAIQRVQILIDGREADTLAGHVDLRRPLQRDESLVRQDPTS